MGVLGRLKRLYDQVAARHEAVYQANGLTAASFDVLATLRRSGAPYALSPSELIAWTMVTSGTMTNRLDRLAAAGVVERKPNPEDGRGSVVALTPQGFELIDRVVTEHVANQHEILSALGAEERAALDGLLRQWLGAYEPPEDGP